MKKIVYIVECLSGGVRKHIDDLLFNIDKNQFQLYVIYSPNRLDDIFKESMNKLKNRVEYFKIDELRREISIKDDLKSFVKIYHILRKIKPDIVHCHSSKAGAIGRVAAKIAGVKCIYYTPHAYIMQNINISCSKKKFFNFIERILSTYFTTLTINVSEGEKNFAVKNKIDVNRKFKVIYNGIDDIPVMTDKNKIRKELGIGETDIVIGVAARFDEQKDPRTFFEIAKRIVKIYNNVKFIYIGDGIDKDKFIKMIAIEKLDSNIIILGFRKDVESLLQIFDIYLITSLYEGMPYSLIEALKAKLPIVATNTIGNNEIVIHEKNGLLFEVGNVEDGVAKLRSIIEGNYNIDYMKKSSYALFENKFLLKDMIANTEEIYNS